MVSKIIENRFYFMIELINRMGKWRYNVSPSRVSFPAVIRPSDSKSVDSMYKNHCAYILKQALNKFSFTMSGLGCNQTTRENGAGSPIRKYLFDLKGDAILVA